MSQYISVEELIAKYLRDVQHVSSDKFDEAHIIEWIGEAEELIGGLSWLRRMIVKLPVINYQVLLPCDFYHIIGLWYAVQDGLCETFNSTMDQLINEEQALRMTKPFTSAPYSNTMESWDIGKIEQKVLGGWARMHYNGSHFVYFNNAFVQSQSQYSKYVYTIHNNVINTNVSEGCVVLIYDAIPTDKRGYPLISNTVWHREACVKYVIYKMNFAKFIRGEIKPDVLAFLRQDWYSALQKARTDDKMMTFDQREHFKRVWNRMVQLGNDWENGYSDTTSNDRWTLN
jgi:hypothetical protein